MQHTYEKLLGYNSGALAAPRSSRVFSLIHSLIHSSSYLIFSLTGKHLRFDHQPTTMLHFFLLSISFIQLCSRISDPRGLYYCLLCLHNTSSLETSLFSPSSQTLASLHATGSRSSSRQEGDWVFCGSRPALWLYVSSLLRLNARSKGSCI